MDPPETKETVESFLGNPVSFSRYSAPTWNRIAL